MSFIVKQNARFSYAVELRIKVDGVQVTDLSGWSAHCSVYSVAPALAGAARGALDAAPRLGEKLADAVATLAPGWLHIDAGSCAHWPVGQACFDVLLVGPAGLRAPSKTVFFAVAPGISQAPA